MYRIALGTSGSAGFDAVVLDKNSSERKRKSTWIKKVDVFERKSPLPILCRIGCTPEVKK